MTVARSDHETIICITISWNNATACYNCSFLKVVLLILLWDKIAKKFKQAKKEVYPGPLKKSVMESFVSIVNG